MAKSFSFLLTLIYLSTVISYNFEDRIVDVLGDERSEEIGNISADSLISSPNVDDCIPVRAVKALGCALSKQYPPFKGLFQPVCERHQLCYACGVVHGITSQQCDQSALLNMYELCSERGYSTFPSFFHCLKQRISAIILLRQQLYRSIDSDSEVFFECHHQCVDDYLRMK